MTCRAVKGFWCLRVRVGCLEGEAHSPVPTPEARYSMVILQNSFVSGLNLGSFF